MDKKTLQFYARRQLPTLKQFEQETVEEFADKVLRLVLDAFPRASNDIIQQDAIEIFCMAVEKRLQLMLHLKKSLELYRKH